MSDVVNHPPHYGSHPSGVECITITEHMNFCRGNAMKYLWRAGEKGSEIEDLMKARWYLDREIARLSGNEPVEPVGAKTYAAPPVEVGIVLPPYATKKFGFPADPTDGTLHTDASGARWHYERNDDTWFRGVIR